MIIINPFIVYDIAFIFSFASIVGIKLLSEKIKTKLRFLPNFISSCFSVTIAANIITIPFTAFNFSKISFGFIFGNFIIAPFISLILIYSAVSVILSSIFGFLSFLFIPLNYLIEILFIPINYIPKISFIHYNIIMPSFAWIFLYFTAISIIFTGIKRKTLKYISVMFIFAYLTVSLFIPSEFLLFNENHIYALGKSKNSISS